MTGEAESLVSNFSNGSTQGEESKHAHGEGKGIMDELASMLKHAREEKGISLQEAGMETRVPAHYLQILEGEGDPRLLAEELYLVPFLRTYSVFLGLDPAVTIPHFIAAVQNGELTGGIPTTRPRRSMPRIALIVLLVVGLAALSFLWIVSERG
jgi:cytoskeletal protein RodZ